MKVKSLMEIRDMFFSYFIKKRHNVINSSSLISNDNSLFFTNSGMNQFKDIFLGLNKNIKYNRVVTSQLCLRINGKHNDLNKIGYKKYHHTLFEMLGNFSFGDYFKFDSINFAWDFLTSKKWLNIDSKKLFITVYYKDYDSYNIWINYVKVNLNNIRIIYDKNNNIKYESDNFWYMSKIGPCGPCTEIFFNNNMDNNFVFSKNEMFKEKKLEDCGFVEIWNIVFIQFNKKKDGKIYPLKNSFVDSGMGLERVFSVLKNVDTTYKISMYKKLIFIISKIFNVKDDLCEIKIISDHIRTIVFLINYGLIPSACKRGYILRLLIRRSIKYGMKLGMKKLFLYKLVDPVIYVTKNFFNEKIKFNRKKIINIIIQEEKRFLETVRNGIKILNIEINKILNNNKKKKKINSKIVYKLYNTYGLPIDFIVNICNNYNVEIMNNFLL